MATTTETRPITCGFCTTGHHGSCPGTLGTRTKPVPCACAPTHDSDETEPEPAPAQPQPAVDQPDASRPEIPEPPHIAALPHDKHGRPIPWFVEQATHDFRVVRADAGDAVRFGWCWICGKPRGRHAAFVIGPMCAVNRISPEPPSHLDCAVYAARACPFLANPSMRRRETGLPDDRLSPPGDMLLRNPGVALVWSSRTWEPFGKDGGTLFDVGDPTGTTWWAHGRPATRAEALTAITPGMPLFQEAAGRDRRPDLALAALALGLAAAVELLPA